MALINSYEFGKIVIDNATYKDDILIYPSGKVEKRLKVNDHHKIYLKELSEVLKENPETIIIGTGYYGIAKVEKELEEEMKKNNIRLIIQNTSDAIKSFNKCKGKKACLLHLTC